MCRYVDITDEMNTTFYKCYVSPCIDLYLHLLCFHLTEFILSQKVFSEPGSSTLTKEQSTYVFSATSWMKWKLVLWCFNYFTVYAHVHVPHLVIVIGDFNVLVCELTFIS